MPWKTERLNAVGWEKAAYYEIVGEISVWTWSPEPPGVPNATPTQVQIHFGEPPSDVCVVRLKSAELVDELIDALIKHRETVWGPKPK